jgi:hypothetical protein
VFAANPQIIEITDTDVAKIQWAKASGLVLMTAEPTAQQGRPGRWLASQESCLSYSASAQVAVVMPPVRSEDDDPNEPFDPDEPPPEPPETRKSNCPEN